MSKDVTDNVLHTVLLIVVLVVLVVISVIAGSVVTSAAERAKAVEAGVGRFVVDPTSGKVHFQYGTYEK